MALSTRDILAQSGILNNWLGESNQQYEATPTVPTRAKKNDFVTNVAKGAGAIAGAVGNTVVDGLMGIPNLVQGTARNMGLDKRATDAETRRKTVEQQDMLNHQAYKAGKISKQQWQQKNQELLKAYQSISDQAKGIQSDYYGYGDVAKDYTSAAGLVLAAASGGATAGAGALSGAAGATRAAQVVDKALMLGKGATGLKALPGAAGKTVLKNTLVTQPTVQVAQELAQGKNIPLNIAALAAPGVIKGISKVVPKIGEKLATAMYGKEGFFGAVAKAGGPDMLAHLDGMPANTAKKFEETLRKVQQYNLDQFKGNARAAAAHFVEYLNKRGKTVDKLTPDELAANLKDWVKANEIIGDLGSKKKLFTGPGGRPLELKGDERVIAGRFDQTDAKGLVEQLSTAKDGSERIKILDKLRAADPDWAKNPHVTEKIYDAALGDDFAKGIRGVGTMRSLFVDGKNVKLPGGYFPTISKSTRAEFKAAKDTAELERGIGPAPVLGKVGKVLEKAGLSTQSQDPATALKFKANLNDEISKIYGTSKEAAGDAAEAWGKLEQGVLVKAADRENYGKILSVNEKSGMAKVSFTNKTEGTSAVAELPIKSLTKVAGAIDVKAAREKGFVPLNADQISDGIRKYAKDHLGISDERQLSVEAIKAALAVPESQARAIKAAYQEAYSRMSASELGLAGKVENNLYKIPGYGSYRRIQGLLRYELNPAFRAQTRVETELLSQLVSGGKNVELPGTKFIDRIFNGGKGTDELDGTINILKERNILEGGGFAGAGAAENNFSAIGARLTRPQERSLAGAVNTLAEKAGKKPADFIKDMDDDTINTIRMIVQYPKEGFTSSNFAKAMNLFIFPSRYTTKLAMMLGKALADAPPLVQIATVKGAADLSSYLNSDEGIKWQSDNSEALGVLAYFNPAMNLKAAYQMVSGQGASLGDLGSLGGLPLGAITQMLQTNGALPKMDTPYINPKTGEVVPDKIPTGMAGALKMSMEDLINSMYSFPGRQLGTDLSKRQITEGFFPVLKQEANEVESVTRTDTTDYQKRVQRVLAAGSSVGTTKVSSVTPAPSRKLQIKKIDAPAPAAPKPKRGKIYGRRPS